jgi:Family of unknown function (DUF6074)
LRSVDWGLAMQRARAHVIPFPQTRRRRFIARLAGRISSAPRRTGEKLLIATLRQQAAAMTRKGVDPDLVKRECHKLESAVRAEMVQPAILPDGVA